MSENVIPLSGYPENRSTKLPRLSAWVEREEVLQPLGPAQRAWAEALVARVIGGAAPPEAEGAAGQSLSLEELWEGVAAVRHALQAAAERGAPPSLVGAAHERLDGEALGLARGAVEQRNAAHARFLQEVSHDIRSPLNSILFLADALRIERNGSLSSGQKRQVGVLYSAAVTLVKLVNDLIDFAQLGRDAPIPVADTSFAVEAVLADVHRLVGPLVEHRRVELRTRTGAVSMRRGDPQLLSRVLLNLVSNAVQAVEEGGIVSVAVGEPRPGTLRIEVTDNAADTDVERLRGLLERDEPRAETRGWTHGLGLTIASRLVSAAGGQLSVESPGGEQTCFAVELPFPAV